MVKGFTRTLLVIFTIIFFSEYAYAQNCDALVVDEAGVLGREIDSVVESAKKVQNLGAEVRVRILDRGNQLDFVQNEFEQSCQSWRATDGGTRNNLISMLMSVEDDQFGFYVGSQWANALSRDRQNQIENDYIFPRFRDGNFSGAFVAGLDQVARVIDAQVNGTLAVSASSGPPVVVQTEATDFTGLWWVLFSVVFVGVVVGGYVAYDRKRKDNEQRRAAQQKAFMAKREVSAAVNKVSDNLPGLEARIAALSGSLSLEESSVLNLELNKIQQTINSVSESFSRIGMGKSDAEQNDLTVQEYSNIETEYKSLSLKVVSTVDLENKLAHLTKLSKELQGNLVTLTSFGKSVSLTLKEVEKQGFKIETATAMLVEAMRITEDAEKNRLAKNLTKTEELIKTSGNKLENTLALANSFSQRKNKLDSDTNVLQTRLSNVNTLIDSTHLVFEKVSIEFAESCWESVKGNGVEAEERLAWATEAVEEVVALANMENQKWEEADVLVKEINQRLNEVESLMRSIVTLEENLQTAKRDSQKEVDDAQADIKKAWDYIREHDDDIPESYEGDLKNSEVHLDRARSELKIAKPDYLYIVKLAQSANSSADTILAKSRSDHEAAERLRQKAASSTRDAKAAHSKAKEYIEDHSSDVGSTVEADIKESATYLATLNSITDLNKKIETANKAEASADSAYKKAKRNVDNAEEERARRRRAANSSISISRPSSFGSSSKSSSSFGGSRSFGSSSRSGGSRSFGSSSRVGGSRGWK